MTMDLETAEPTEIPDPAHTDEPASMSVSERPAFCTKCNTPIPEKKNVKCCPKCGMMIKDMIRDAADPDGAALSGIASSRGIPPESGVERPEYCTECGTPIPAKKNAKCCPKCGTLFSDMKKPGSASDPDKATHPVPEKTTYCTKCGALLHSGDLFCSNCHASISGPVTNKEPTRMPETEKPRIVTVRKDPIKKAVIILLVVGLCLLWTGVIGKVILGQVRSGVYHALETQGLDMLDRYAGGVVENLLIATIQNDYNGFVNSFNKILSVASSISGSSGSMDFLMGSMASSAIRQYLPELRSELREQAGPVWIVLYLASYCHVFLIAGAIITIGAVAAWIIRKCKIQDIKEQKMIPALIIGGVWIVLVTVITIVMMCIKT